MTLKIHVIQNKSRHALRFDIKLSRLYIYRHSLNY